MTPPDLKPVEEILGRHPRLTGNVISVLHDVQSAYGYLPADVLRHLAARTGVPITRLYGIASFYHLFSLEPKGRHRIHVCLGTACHVKGARRILDDVERNLGIKAGETTPDLRYSVSDVRCVGACSFAPVVVVDDSTYGEMTPRKVSQLLEKHE